MTIEIPIKDVMPNPFRHKDHQIEEGKIEALIASYQSTGIWPTITARQRNGHVERAFGDHRIEAAKRLYGSNHKIEINIEEISDEQMLKRMANENRDEWKTSFMVAMEMVESTVKAYANGQVQLPATKKIGPKKQLSERSGSYNAYTVADFLGWKQANQKPHYVVTIALGALELIDTKVLHRDQFKGLTNAQAESLVVETHTAQKRVKHDETVEKDTPSKVGAAVSKGFKEGKLAVRKARDITNKMTSHIAYKPVPPSDKFIGSLCSNIASILSPQRDKKRLDKIEAVLKFREDLPREQVERVAQFLLDTAQTCLEWASKFNPQLEYKLKQLTQKTLSR